MKIFKGMLLALSMGVAGIAWAGSVNINTANLKALESLHGIGAAKAQAIIDYRSRHGAFTSVSDLAKVKGIGAKTAKALADEVTVGKSK